MKPYVPPRGPLDAKVMIVGEAPGSDETRDMKPFVGYAGMEMSRMLHEAGLLESECFITNVLRCQPPNNNEEYYISFKKKDAPNRTFIRGAYVRPEVVDHISHLDAEITAVQPDLIIAFGNLALWALTGEKGITKWRGSILSSHGGTKVIPTLHPSYVNRFWAARPIVVQDLRRAAVEAKFPEIREPEFNFITRPNFTQAIEYLETMLHDLSVAPRHISCDIETRGGQIACIGFATSATDAICIPLMCLERKAGYWTEEEELSIVKLIRQILTHCDINLSGQNFMYDAQYIAKHWGFVPDLWWDTMNMQHVLFPDMPASLKPKSLGFLAAMYCACPRFWKDEGKLWNAKMPEEQLWEYNCQDAVRTWEIAEAQRLLPAKMGLTDAADFQMKLWKPLVYMMLRGVAQDTSARKRFSAEVAKHIGTLQTRLDFLTGRPIKAKSTLLRDFFYKDLKVKANINRKTGALSTDDESLDRIGKREPLLEPFVQTISHIRSAGVFKNTFIAMQLSEDARVRCSFNMARAKTFRLTSSKDAFGAGGNLQNQPRNNVARKLYEAGGKLTSAELATLLGTSESKAINLLKDVIDDGYVQKHGDLFICNYALPDIRRLFVPDPGYTICDCDLDRADLQVVVWEAEDEELKQMLREGVDVHAENAKVVRLSRDHAKQFIHAIDYGASARKLAVLFGKTVAEMEAAKSRWFSAHPGVPRWQRRTEVNLPKTENKFGYKIHFFDRLEQTLPKALAWIPQSTVAIVINKGLVRVAAEVPEFQSLLQVHDSLVFQLPTDRVDELMPIVMEKLLVTIPYDDPLVIPISAKISTTSWGECKEWKPKNTATVKL